MTIAPPAVREPHVSDSTAIEQLHAALDRQRKASRSNPIPTLQERQEHLQALCSMLMTRREDVREACTSDFGVHPTVFADLIETLAPVGRAAMAIAELPRYLEVERRQLDPGLYGDTYAEMRWQPKGVVGAMSPWNLPFELGIGALVDILAAGNRAILKPSDLAPATSALIAEMIAATYDPDHVTTAVGGLELAREFPRLPWDHLLYTGSTAIGREVMRAAAENLVPVTLELGGKSPAVMLPGAVDERAVDAILGFKSMKSGQVCVTVDHVRVARADLDRFVELAQSWMEQRGQLSAGPDNTGLITGRHYERVLGLVEEVRSRGARVIDLEDGGSFDPETRRMPLQLVVDPPADSRLMREEIFGPVLPLVPYDDVEDVVEELNVGDRPLALYVFGSDDTAVEHVLSRTSSGGATVNGVAMHAAPYNVGFGGVGASGMGRHHGIEGFREFSTQRPVVRRSAADGLGLLAPPYGAEAAAAADAAFGG